LHGNIRPEEAGIAMMMKDLYTDFNSPLTNETLLAWHDKLLNGRTDLVFTTLFFTTFFFTALFTGFFLVALLIVVFLAGITQHLVLFYFTIST